MLASRKDGFVVSYRIFELKVGDLILVLIKKRNDSTLLRVALKKD